MWTLVSGPGMDTINSPFSPIASVNPSVPGVNYYLVMVTDACGLMSFDTVRVEVLLDCDLDVPNVFTPNADGYNDFFTIDANGISKFSIVIYNRWGSVVFKSEDINNSWDGNNVTDGTYFYIIHAESINGKEYNPKGFVQRLGNK
jgi:gliding motility-associated-like protein